MPKVENAEQIEVVPCDDGWQEYEEQVSIFKSSKNATGYLRLRQGGMVEKGRFCRKFVQ